MPSTLLMPFSGGVTLMSGSPFSGSPQMVGGVQLRLAKAAPSLVYVGVPNLSGEAPTATSGGSLSSGGMADGMELSPGDSYFIPKTRLQNSGVCSIQVIVPAAASGGRLFWELF